MNRHYDNSLGEAFYLGMLLPEDEQLFYEELSVNRDLREDLLIAEIWDISLKYRMEPSFNNVLDIADNKNRLIKLHDLPRYPTASAPGYTIGRRIIILCVVISLAAIMLAVFLRFWSVVKGA